MSRFLATAAMVVGGVALVATGVGAAASIGLLGQYAAGSATAAFVTTAATVAKVAGFAAAALMATSALTAPKATGGGSPDQWKADPNAGIDIVFGDAYNGGHIIYRQAYGSTNKYQSIVTEWSLGPVQSLDTLYIDQIARGVVGQIVDVPNRGFVLEARQLGQCPEPAALTLAGATPYGWSDAHRLSGKAATMMRFEYDTKGKNTQTSMPTCGWRGKGVLCYDPRKDSTYPGGDGPQRVADHSTWAWSDNPYVVALTWCLGWRQNGKLAAGVGLPISGIIVDNFVEGANVAQINGWRVGGVKSTLDDKWDVLTDILQAGAGEPLRLGAMLGCIVSTPRVSLATIDRDALAQGEVSIVTMQARRDRINALVPRYWSEQISTDPQSGITTTTWAEVPAEPIIVAEHVAADGRQVRKETSFPLVQCFAGEEPKQVGTLARYAIENAREFGPINLPLKVRWIGYKPGDVVTVDLPDAGLLDQDVMLLTRSLDAGSGIVTVTARSETAAKHAFALAQTAVPPVSPGLPSNAWMFEVPGAPTGAATQIVQSSASLAYPVTSSDTTISIAAFTAALSDGTTSFAFPAATITGLTAATSYLVIFDRSANAYAALVQPASGPEVVDPDNIIVRSFVTANADRTYPPTETPPGGDGGGGYGGGGGRNPNVVQQ
ncbi:hypothetical protein KZ810_07945 [Sphingomonas sp. RHCKR47]|uniref:hypothetical protein n=1 Tax=Sphingomonas citricola TaxID=2862498 RepID=UPI001CA5C51F|nr:hypothetical protein [Sphingomonas citricola]MBW6523428.1 hypothetical protein [Sphingomonas citricola]